jgi:hypothetical protein
MSIDKFPNREQNFTPSLQKWFSSIYDSFRNVSTSSDVTIDDADRGIVLKDSAGVYWRFSTDTSGNMTSTNLGTTKPQGI